MVEWKDVVNYEGVYQVSNYGEVKRTKQSSGAKSGRVLKARLTKHGYEEVVLSLNNIPKHKAIHRLVAEAFVRNQDVLNNVDINHIDGNKRNNIFSNLEWVTRSQNIQHSYKTLGRVKNISPKLSIENVSEIRKLLSEKQKTQKEIGLMFGVSNQLISCIKRDKIWSSI